MSWHALPLQVSSFMPSLLIWLTNEVSHAARPASQNSCSCLPNWWLQLQSSCKARLGSEVPSPMYLRKKQRRTSRGVYQVHWGYQA